MLEYRPLGNVEFGGDVGNPSCLKTVLGKVPHGHLNYAGALAFRTRPLGAVTIAGGRHQIACDSIHN